MDVEKTVTLWCGVYGGGSVFSVQVARDATVEDLQKAIFNKKRYGERYRLDPSDLTLYLARKDDVWLEHDDVTDDILHCGVEMEIKMRPLWSLTKTELFGPSFEPPKEAIHVLVKLPDAIPAGSAPHWLTVDSVPIAIVTPRMSLNPPPQVAYWNALRDDTTEIKSGALITLPEGVYLLGSDFLGSRLFIRDCYPALWAYCQQKIHEPKTPHLVILGNPGIGKTFFGFVILLHLARQGATVVYQSGPLDKCFLFCREGVVEGSREDFKPLLNLSTTYYIVDAVKPPSYSAKTILLTSPRRSIWFEFNKSRSRSCYMPVWTRDEILDCRALMYADIPVNVVLDCFRRWGGIARYVLEYAQISDQQALLEKAIAIVELDVLVKAVGQMEADPDQVSHRLLHYHVDAEFASNYLVFASHYVQQEVYNCLYKSNQQKLLQFIRASGGINAVAVLRGCLFEEHVHAVLPRGGKFRVRRLIDRRNSTAVSSSTIEDIELPEQQTVVFNGEQEVVNAGTNEYLRPAIANFPSVDAIMKPDTLFQVTIARNHPCKQNGLDMVLKLLQNPSAPRLYFVVPPELFDAFEYQRYVNTDGKTETTKIFKNVQSIQQFALEVKLTSE